MKTSVVAAGVDQRLPLVRGVQRQIQLQIQIDADEARDVLGALDVAGHPVDGVGDAAQQGRVVVIDALPDLHRASTQVSLLPPPCDEFTTSEPFAQRHARQSAGQHVDVLAVENVGPQIDVPAFEVVVDQASARATAPASAARCSCADSRRSSPANSSRCAAVECGPTSMP